LIFNYGRNEVKNFLISNALFWLEHYHIDGLRVDAVASRLTDHLDPGEVGAELSRRPCRPEGHCLHEATQPPVLRATHPGILMIAEETGWPGVSCSTSTVAWALASNGTCGLDENHPALHAAVSHPPEDHHGEATFSMPYADDENFIPGVSHDEVVHGKRSLLKQDAGRPAGAAVCRSAAGTLCLDVDTQARSCFSWAATSPVDRVARIQSLDWHSVRRGPCRIATVRT